MGGSKSHRATSFTPVYTCPIYQRSLKGNAWHFFVLAVTILQCRRMFNHIAAVYHTPYVYMKRSLVQHKHNSAYYELDVFPAFEGKTRSILE